MSGRPPTRTFSTRSVSRPGTPGGRSINSSFVDNDYYTDYVTVSAEYNELIAVYKETLDELHISQEETARYQVENDKLGTKNVQLKNVVNLHQSRTSELETRLLSSESKSSSKDRNTLNIISKCNGLEKKLAIEEEKSAMVNAELDSARKKISRFERDKKELENKFFKICPY